MNKIEYVFDTYVDLRNELSQHSEENKLSYGQRILLVYLEFQVRRWCRKSMNNIRDDFWSGLKNK